MVAHVVAAPAAAEVVAAGGQFTDEVVQPLVVGVAAGFGVQDRDAGVGGGVPVGIEVVGGVVVRKVYRTKFGTAPLGDGLVDGGVHGATELVGGQQVHPAVADDGRAR